MKNLKYLLLLMPLIFSSCDEEDEFKVPVDIQFSMELIQENNMVSHVQFSDIEIAIESFSFEGDREQSEDVEFSKEYEPGLKILANPSAVIDEFDITIPQGIYTSISISMETDYSEQNSGLVLRGTYNAPDGDIPMVVSLSSQIYFEIEAENENGNREIVIKRESPPTAVIRFDPTSWFQLVPQMMLLEADLMNINGKSSIYISEENNEDIFEIIMSRLDNDTIITFYN